MLLRAIKIFNLTPEQYDTAIGSSCCNHCAARSLCMLANSMNTKVTDCYIYDQLEKK